VGGARRVWVGFRRPPTQLAFGLQIARRATAADADARNKATANHSERHMKLNVKCSNGKTLNLEFDGAKTVLELKEAISAEDGNPPATQQRPPPPSFGSRGRRLGRRRFAMYTGGLVEDDAFADFDDY